MVSGFAKLPTAFTSQQKGRKRRRLALSPFFWEKGCWSTDFGWKTCFRAKIRVFERFPAKTRDFRVWRTDFRVWEWILAGKRVFERFPGLRAISWVSHGFLGVVLRCGKKDHSMRAKKKWIFFPRGSEKLHRAKKSYFFCQNSEVRKTRFFAGRVEKQGVLAESRRKISVPRILGVKKKTFGLVHGRAFFSKLVA